MKKVNAQRLRLGFLIVTLILHAGCDAQTKSEKIDALINAYAEQGKFNGSVLVADHGAVIFKKGYGWAQEAARIPNRPGTMFRLASVTKQFTALLVLQLVAENKIKLEAPVTSYLPGYPRKTGDRITIHHLLAHTSGIPEFTAFPGFHELEKHPHRPDELVRLFADSALDFTPGQEFQYSNSGYVLLGAIIEKITGKTYAQVVHEKIFDPLQMKHSGYDNDTTTRPGKAQGYYMWGTSFRKAETIDMSVPFSAGGLCSTVEDLYLWDQALYTEKLLPAKFRDKLFEPHSETFYNGHYGYGWFVESIPAGTSGLYRETVNHSGSINGFSTNITRIPSDRSLIVLLNNTGNAPLRDITSSIVGILNDQPFNYPPKSIAHGLVLLLHKARTPEALEFYKTSMESPHYYINENEMNLAGYDLLQSGKTTEAALLFELNTQAYPYSFNVYDSFGEALLELGDTVRAIENYRKSVRLNPGNGNGLDVLNNLGVRLDSLVKNIPVEKLMLLEGDYLSVNPPGGKEWKISFKIIDGQLNGNDRGYRFRLVPVGENSFVNPDDNATVVFNTTDRDNISLVVFGDTYFRKKAN